MASLETTKGLSRRDRRRMQQYANTVPTERITYWDNSDKTLLPAIRNVYSQTDMSAPTARPNPVPTDLYANRESAVQTAPATRKRRNTNGDYTIQKGDTLSAIAKRYGTTVQAIAEANGIADVNKIYVGDSLNIPGNTTARTSQPRSEAMQRSKGRIDTAVAVSKVPKTLSVNRTQTTPQEDNRIYRPQRQLPEVNVTARRNPTAKEVQQRFHIPTYLPEVNIRSSRPGFSQQDMQAIRRSQQQNPPVVYNGRSKSSLRRYQRY